MKAFKYIISTVLLIALVWSCSEDEFGNTDFVSTVVAPTNVSVLFNITQDNTGFVTITPNSEGAVSYDIYFGDNTTDPVQVRQGENITNTYAEGSYDVKVIATGITGLKSEITNQLEVSFKAPENLEVTIENDEAVSKQVNVTATADWATMFDVYFGEPGNDDPLMANIGNTISYIYAEPGIYTIRVVAKGAAIATTEYTVEFEATAILAPLAAAPTPPNRNEVDVVSIFSDAYSNITVNEWNPGWGQSTTLSEFVVDNDASLKYDYLNYTGIVTDYGNPTNLSSMEYVHFDYWTNDAESIGFKIVNTNQPDGSPEKESEITISEITAGSWVSVEVPLSEFTTDMSAITQMLFVSNGVTVFIDNLYFWKTPSAPSPLAGTWKLAPEAGALKVGPSPGNGDWWTSDAQAVIDRACFFDDSYVFGSDGSFNNVLGTDTWLEVWQGTADACGTPVAPYDGLTSATFTHNQDAGTVTINGTGAYLGLPKANNAGELPNVAVPSSITYEVALSDNDNTATIMVEAGSGVFWTYKMVRDGAIPSSPVVGTWKLAPEEFALKVGPSANSGEWWASNAADVTTRACLFDDTYVFNSDGTFNNVLGSDTWLEVWQGVAADVCGAPVSPHNGLTTATYTYDENAGTITLNGTGAYLGISKTNNEGELPNVAVPTSISYGVTLSDNDNTMVLLIEAGSGVFWTFKLVREGGTGGTGGGNGTQIDLPVDFESSTIDYTLTDFGDNQSSLIVDPNDANNMIVKVIKPASAPTWAGTTIGTSSGFATNIPITLTNSKMTVRVWSPDTGTPIRLKIEDANDATHTCETEVNTTVTGWETLEFDFINQATGTELLSVGLTNGWVYNKASIFFNFGTDGATAGEKTYYFDDVIHITN